MRLSSIPRDIKETETEMKKAFNGIKVNITLGKTGWIEITISLDTDIPDNKGRKERENRKPSLIKKSNEEERRN